MMRQFSERYLHSRHKYSDPLEAQRAQALLVFFVIGIITLMIASIGMVFTGAFASVPPATTLGLAAAPIVLLILYHAVQRGYYRFAAASLVVLTILISAQTFLTSSFTYHIVMIFVPITLAGTLLGWRTVVMTDILLITLLVQRTFIQPAATGAERPIIEFVVITQVIIVISAVLIVFGSNIQRSAARFIDRFNILQGISEALDLKSDALDEPALIGQVIDIMRDLLNYNYAQVFLADADMRLSQRIASGLTKAQVNVDSSITLSESSAIYQALRQNEIVTVTRSSSEARREHLLPGLQTALAVPIHYEDMIIGVLDVQSENSTLPSETEMLVIGMVAAQLGTAIAERRVISDLRENLKQQNSLIERQQDRLLEYERAERRAILSSWENYLEQRSADYLGFDLTPESDDPVIASDFDESLHPVLEAGDVTVQIEGDMQIVSTPILLRGQSLGVMTFKVPQGRQIVGLRQTELIRSVVQRLALALENKRLFEQSQSQAQRERRANEVGNLLLSTTDIETVLRLAVENFNEALGAVQTKIHLQPDAQPPAEERK